MLEADVGEMKVALGRRDLGDILFGLQGGDPHDWYHGLCRAEQLYPTLFRIWLLGDGIALGVYVKIARWWVKEVEATIDPDMTQGRYDNTAWDEVESTDTIFSGKFSIRLLLAMWGGGKSRKWSAPHHKRHRPNELAAVPRVSLPQGILHLIV